MTGMEGMNALLGLAALVGKTEPGFPMAAGKRMEKEGWPGMHRQHLANSGALARLLHSPGCRVRQYLIPVDPRP